MRPCAVAHAERFSLTDAGKKRKASDSAGGTAAKRKRKSAATDDDSGSAGDSDSDFADEGNKKAAKASGAKRAGKAATGGVYGRAVKVRAAAVAVVSDRTLLFACGQVLTPFAASRRLAGCKIQGQGWVKTEGQEGEAWLGWRSIMKRCCAVIAGHAVPT